MWNSAGVMCGVAWYNCVKSGSHAGQNVKTIPADICEWQVLMQTLSVVITIHFFTHANIIPYGISKA